MKSLSLGIPVRWKSWFPPATSFGDPSKDPSKPIAFASPPKSSLEGRTGPAVSTA